MIDFSEILKDDIELKRLFKVTAYKKEKNKLYK